VIFFKKNDSYIITPQHYQVNDIKTGEKSSPSADIIQIIIKKHWVMKKYEKKYQKIPKNEEI